MGDEVKDDLRADIAASLKELSTPEGDNNGQEQQVAEPAAAPPAEPAGSPPAEPAATGRDASGRFAPKVPAKDPVPADPQQAAEGVAAPAQPITPAPIANNIRPPISWKPEEREGWEKIDPRHQAAIIRREREVDNTLRQTAQERQLAAAFRETVEPFRGFIAAEGSDDLTAVKHLLQTAAFFRTAAPMQKASAVADIIFQHGVDINMLDTVMRHKVSGQQIPADPMSGVMQMFEQRLAPIMEYVQRNQTFEQQRQQQMAQAVEQTLEQFISDPANEFAVDVANDMADILEFSANRGQNMSLQDAYRRATLLHPTISKIVEARKAVNGAAQQNAAALRAKNASVSVPGGGAPSQGGADEDVSTVRSAILASAKELAARR